MQSAMRGASNIVELVGRRTRSADELPGDEGREQRDNEKHGHE